MERRTILAAAAVFFCGALVFAGEAIPNWPAPAAWSPSRSPGRVAALDVTGPLPFIGLAPCRILDTRGNGFSGAFGPPALVASASRNFPLSGQCGIPSGAEAVSLNVTVTNTQGPGFILMYPQGGAQPLVSTLNYVAGQTVANAAVVPLGTGGGVSVVAGVSGTDLVIDTNGYYASAAANQANTFKVVNNGGPSVPAIWGETDSTGGDAAGVLGIARATTGQTFGVDGQNFSTSNFSSGVRGFAMGLSGRTSGVYGQTFSRSALSCGVLGGGSDNILSDTAGVRGIMNAGIFTTQTYNAAGVRGETVFGYGVLGISSETGVGAALISLINNQQLLYALLAAKGPNNYAVFAGGDIGGTGAKYFVEPHPADASKVIRYVSLEGPESGTYFRGRGKFQNGLATVEVPEDFRMVTDAEGLSIQVTPIGEIAGVAVVKLDLNEILVKASRNVEFFYTVNGVRKTHKDLRPIGPGNEFVPQSAEAKIPAHLTEGQKAMVISNGTYNEDGTVNMGTAERLGWTRHWAERESKSREAAAPRKVEEAHQ